MKYYLGEEVIVKDAWIGIIIDIHEGKGAEVVSKVGIATASRPAKHFFGFKDIKPYSGRDVEPYPEPEPEPDLSDYLYCICTPSDYVWNVSTMTQWCRTCGKDTNLPF